MDLALLRNQTSSAPQHVTHFVLQYQTCSHARPVLQYRGVPSPGFITQDLENPAQKKFFKVRIHRSAQRRFWE